jgi:hypothetical protein
LEIGCLRVFSERAENSSLVELSLYIELFFEPSYLFFSVLSNISPLILLLSVGDFDLIEGEAVLLDFLGVHPPSVDAYF